MCFSHISFPLSSTLSKICGKYPTQTKGTLDTEEERWQCKSEDNGAAFLKHGKENTQSTVIYPAKIPLKKRWNKDFFRHTKAERIYHQLTTIIGNVKWNPSGRRKIIPDENLNQHIGMKITRKGNMNVNTKSFLFLKMSLNELFKANMIAIYCGILQK